jgi:hypothetical protein
VWYPLDADRAAKGNIRFRGYGIDMNPCRLARSGPHQSGVAARVVIRRSDAALPARILRAGEIRAIDRVRGRSFLNACFRPSIPGAVDGLRRRRSTFPRQSAWFVDCYSELGRRSGPRIHPIGARQDLVQAISGQGVPPATKSAWQLLYHCAGCTLIRSRNFDGAIRWSVHEVRL